MGTLTLGRLALAAGLLGLLLAPWHGMEGGLEALSAWPGGDAAPLLALLLDGSRWWLWPVVGLLGLATIPIVAGRSSGGLVASTGLALLAFVLYVAVPYGEQLIRAWRNSAPAAATVSYSK